MPPERQQRLSGSFVHAPPGERSLTRGRRVKWAKCAILSGWLPAFPTQLTARVTPCCPVFPHTAMPGFPTPNTRPACLSVPVPVSHSLSVSAALVNLRTKHPLRKCVSAHQVLRDRVGAGVCLGVSRGTEIQKEKKKAFSLTLGSLYPRKENRLISRSLIIQDKHRNTSCVRSVGGYEKVWRRR